MRFREDYTLIISDLRVPSINGMDKKIKELNPYIRTILMTAFATNDDLFRDYVKNELIKKVCSETHPLRRFVRSSE